METTTPQTTEPQRPLNDPPPVKRSAVVRWLVGALALGTVLFSVVGLAGSWVIPLDLANHFRFQYTLILIATTLGLLLLKAKRVVWASALGLAVNLVFVVPLYLPPADAAADADGPALTILNFNVHTSNRRTDEVAQLIRASGADLVFLQEVNQRWLNELDGKLGPYQVIAQQPRADNFGIVGYVRVEADQASSITIRSHRVLFLATEDDGVPAIEVQAEVDGRAIAVLSMHPLPPVDYHYTRARNAALAEAGDWARQQQTPHVIVGDLNATPWSVPFRELTRSADLVNSQRGYGRAPSWPSSFGGLGMIPIDHLLHSDDLVTTDRVLGEACGSDHLPLTVKLQWAAP